MEKATPRPGVLELMDEALSDPTVRVGVCSASTKEAVTKVLDVTLGEERRKGLDVTILGNDVSRLKPDPMIYETFMDIKMRVPLPHSLTGKDIKKVSNSAQEKLVNSTCTCIVDYFISCKRSSTHHRTQIPQSKNIRANLRTRNSTKNEHTKSSSKTCKRRVEGGGPHSASNVGRPSQERRNCNYH